VSRKALAIDGISGNYDAHAMDMFNLTIKTAIQYVVIEEISFRSHLGN
jgi:hypothetical protein